MRSAGPNRCTIHLKTRLDSTILNSTMAEHYERDEYSDEEYSDESINVGCVCSWSINDIAQHRPVVNIALPDSRFNSDSAQISDEKLYGLADRLQQAESGDATAQVARRRHAGRASLRDYEQEAWWSIVRSPRRTGQKIELEPVPNETYRHIVIRSDTGP